MATKANDQRPEGQREASAVDRLIKLPDDPAVYVDRDRVVQVSVVQVGCVNPSDYAVNVYVESNGMMEVYPCRGGWDKATADALAAEFVRAVNGPRAGEG